MNTEFNEFLKSVNGKKCTVVGMGVSNIPLIRLLLEHGADPDVCCNHKSNYKTPRELAAGKPEILEIFNIYKGEKKD